MTFDVETDQQLQ